MDLLTLGELANAIKNHQTSAANLSGANNFFLCPKVMTIYLGTYS